MEILIKFEFNQKIYCVGKENNQFKYFYLKDNLECFDLSADEIKLINKVAKKIMPSGYFVKTSDYILNNNKYEIYYDKITGIRYFNPIPKDEDLIKLNMIFNNTSEYLASLSDKWKFWNNKDFFKRLLVIDSILLSVAVSNLVVSSVQYISEQRAEEIEARNHYEMALSQMEDTSHLSDEEFIERIMQAVDRNDNLNEEEKEKLRAYEFALLDNKEYSDIEFLEDTLSRLNFSYNEDEGMLSNGMYCAAWYAEWDKEATFFNVSELSDIDGSVLGHEVAHSFSKPLYYDKSNSFLVESNNVIFTNEYMVDFGEDKGYFSIINYGKALMELIGPEVFKQYHSLPSTDLIANELCKIIDNENSAYKLLSCLDEYKTIYDLKSPYYFKNNEEKLNLDDLKMQIYKSMDKYYYAKYGIHIEDDLIMLYYMNEDMFNSKIKMLVSSAYPEDNITSDMFNNVEITNERAYFNSQLVSQNKGITCNVSTSIGNYMIKIDDSNRYMKDSNIEVKKIPFFYEGYNSIQNNKHNESITVSLTKILIELIGEETVKYSIDSNSLDFIIKSLNQIIPDNELAIQFFDNLCKYANLRNYCEAYIDNSEMCLGQFLDTNENRALYNTIYEQIGTYYYAKYGIEMENDLIMLYNLECFFLDHPKFDRKMFEYAGLNYDDLKTKYDYIIINRFNKEKTDNNKQSLYFELEGLTDLGEDCCSVDLLAEIELNNENRYVIDNTSKGQSR